MKRAYRARHLFTPRDGAPEWRHAVDRFTGLQCRQYEFAVRRHLDGNCYDINPLIADHREGIGKPAISPKGLSRFPCTLLVACRYGRELQAVKTVDRCNMRHLRPARLGVCTDDSDTNFSLIHDLTSLLLPVPHPSATRLPAHETIRSRQDQECQ